ncbi:GTP-binding protein [bacterium]|nr:GTP-binding protein [candidate division CSSED10-310 bacterium]
MLQKKICMLGAFAVGKTSLVQRFVKSLFSEKYQTTVGVRIDKKVVTLGDESVNLLLWDIQGEDELQKLRLSYLRGASGYLLVVDGTRAGTVTTALALQEAAAGEMGQVPFVCIVNKADLTEEWEVGPEEMARLKSRGWNVLTSSAKTGEGVEEAFLDLTRRMLQG